MPIVLPVEICKGGEYEVFTEPFQTSGISTLYLQGILVVHVKAIFLLNVSEKKRSFIW